MKISCLLIVILTLFSSCSNDLNQDKTQETEQRLFGRYLKESFNNSFKNKSYYIIVGKRICKLCEVGTLEGFRIHQEKINASKITLITDFTKKEIDTLLIDNFKPTILIDSLSNFENYLFPRSYITIYKVVNGEIKNFAFFSEKENLNRFLDKENLKK